MLLPIWAASWEIECCQPEAEIGNEWKAPVLFRPGTDPWWSTDHGATATAEQRRLGIVRLESASESVDEELGQQLMTSGPISFRAEAGVLPGLIEGRLHLDAHADAGGFEGRDEVRGVVDRVQLVPLRYVEQTEKYFVPAEQMDAIEVETTTQRRDVARSRDHELMVVQLLVWLKLGSP